MRRGLFWAAAWRSDTSHKTRRNRDTRPGAGREAVKGRCGGNMKPSVNGEEAAVTGEIRSGARGQALQAFGVRPCMHGSRQGEIHPGVGSHACKA